MNETTKKQAKPTWKLHQLNFTTSTWYVESRRPDCRAIHCYIGAGAGMHVDILAHEDGELDIRFSQDGMRETQFAAKFWVDGLRAVSVIVAELVNLGLTRPL